VSFLTYRYIYSSAPLRYGGKLARKCRDYKHAEDEAKEFLTAIEWNWMKTAAQLNFLKRIAESLDPEYLAMQGLILAELDGKLKKATLTLNQLSTGQQWVDKHDETTIAARLASFDNLTPGKKTLYAIRKTSLKSIVDDLEKWQGRYDLTWMLIMRMESPSISSELKKESEKAQSNRNPFIISAKEMRDAARESIGTSNSTAQSVWLDHSSFDITYPFPQLPYPTAFIAAEVQDSGRKIMLDTMHCHPMADVPRTTREVCNLARVLSKVDPSTFGLLKCLGIMKGSETVPHELTGFRTLPTFTFVFDVSPELSNPRSLRTVLQQAAVYSLNERFELAKQITHSILYVHTARFVHKNIRPETIVVFTNSKSDIGAPFLLGFEKVRHEDGQTYGGGDGVWEKNLCKLYLSNFLCPPHVISPEFTLMHSRSLSDPARLAVRRGI
jgi:hypothetical protein